MIFMLDMFTAVLGTDAAFSIDLSRKVLAAANYLKHFPKGCRYPPLLFPYLDTPPTL